MVRNAVEGMVVKDLTRPMPTAIIVLGQMARSIGKERGRVEPVLEKRVVKEDQVVMSMAQSMEARRREIRVVMGQVRHLEQMVLAAPVAKVGAVATPVVMAIMGRVARREMEMTDLTLTASQEVVKRMTKGQKANAAGSGVRMVLDQVQK